MEGSCFEARKGVDLEARTSEHGSEQGCVTQCPMSSATSKLGSRESSEQSVHGNALLAAIRREVEASEGRFDARVNRLERQTECLRQATERVARWDERLASVETSLLERDRRVAEMGGSITAFAGELQSLSKRVASMDVRVGEGQRGHGEVSARARLEDFMQDSPSTAHGGTAHREDTLKHMDSRIYKLQGLVDGLCESKACLGRRLDVTEAQVEHLAEAYEHSLHPADDLRMSTERLASGWGAVGGEASSRPPSTPPVPPEVLQAEQAAASAQQMAQQAVDAIKELASEVNYVQVRMEEHELRHSTVHSKLQSQGMQLRELRECVARVADQATDQTVGEQSPDDFTELGVEASKGHQDNPVDRRINALEEKLAASGRRGLLASPQRPAILQDDERREAEAPVAHCRDLGEVAVHEVRAQVEALSAKVSSQGHAIEEIRSRLLLVQKQAVKLGEERGVSGAPPVAPQGAFSQNATESLAAEVRALTQCLASGQAVVSSLAPRLLAMTAGDPALGASTTRCLEPPAQVEAAGKERKASREARGRQSSQRGCWRWFG
mmetsp:Transcript_49782/g.115553  ORF Transcript_49782/g.115553 Transcript_49782/m.115553 type:complete len:555 (-) Transcript_49782:89-1753(-)